MHFKKGKGSDYPVKEKKKGIHLLNRKMKEGGIAKHHVTETLEKVWKKRATSKQKTIPISAMFPLLEYLPTSRRDMGRAVSGKGEASYPLAD